MFLASLEYRFWFDMPVLNYPKRQSIDMSTHLFRLYDIAKSTEEDDITFDLSRTESLTPFGIIVLASTISECLKKGKRCTYSEPQDEVLRKFLSDAGFTRHFGLNNIRPEWDSIQTGRVQLRKIPGLDPDFIEMVTDIFDYHLNISPGVKGSLRMSLIETMTNVVDHSKVEDYYVCAWTYPDKRQIRLCIADLGIGILASLRTTSDYSGLNDDYEAIHRSIEPGVSCRSGRDGMGLSHIRNFIKVNEGQMCIISGSGKVFWKFDQGKILRQKMPVPFAGTIVKLLINIDKEGFYFLSDEKDYLF